MPRADDQKVLSDIFHVIQNGLRWVDAPAVYGPHKTLYNRFRRWSENGIFQLIFMELSGSDGKDTEVLMIDATGNPGKPPLPQPEFLRSLDTTGRLECAKDAI